MHSQTLIKLAAVLFSGLALAHPGEDHEHDHAADLAKREYFSNARRSLNSCADKLAASGLEQRALARRRATVAKHAKRSKRTLVARNATDFLNKTHHSDLGYTPSTPIDTVFATNGTCILQLEGDIGPYWIPGELVRDDLTEDQPGVPLILDGQFVDIETCEPVKGLYWDIWNCNSTGVYSGVVADGNGDASDPTNLNATFLRGLSQTDSDGVVQFQTIFPGHYSGRATHHHIVAHLNVTALDNGTITGGHVAHVGQLFYDQDLITQIEATAPYNTNTVNITKNADDYIFLGEAAGDSDPILEYSMLGDSLEDGIFAWIQIAVNTSATYDPAYSVVYTSGGGVVQSGGTAGAGGPGGPPGGPGGPGGPPNSTVSSTATSSPTAA